MSEVLAIDAVAIPQQESGSRVVRKSCHDLLSRPLGSRIGRDVEVDDATTVMLKDQEDIEHSQRYHEVIGNVPPTMYTSADGKAFLSAGQHWKNERSPDVGGATGQFQGRSVSSRARLPDGQACLRQAGP